jgi:hypothetical protein
MIGLRTTFLRTSGGRVSHGRASDAEVCEAVGRIHETHQVAVSQKRGFDVAHSIVKRRTRLHKASKERFGDFHREYLIHARLRSDNAHGVSSADERVKIVDKILGKNRK